MLLIAMSYNWCGRNLRAKLMDTVINSLSSNHACLNTFSLVYLSGIAVIVNKTEFVLNYELF